MFGGIEFRNGLDRDPLEQAVLLFDDGDIVAELAKGRGCLQADIASADDNRVPRLVGKIGAQGIDIAAGADRMHAVEFGPGTGQPPCIQSF